MMYPWMRTIYKKTFILADFSVFKLYGIFALVWITEQLISMGVETLLWGKPTPHWFDIAFTVGLSGVFAMFAMVLADWKEDVKYPHFKDYFNHP